MCYTECFTGLYEFPKYAVHELIRIPKIREIFNIYGCLTFCLNMSFCELSRMNMF